MKNDVLITDDLLLSKILQIRNQKVMIDRDLAELYGVPTKLNEQVKRNLKRFPMDFMFQFDPTRKTGAQAILPGWIFDRIIVNAFTNYGILMS